MSASATQIEAVVLERTFDAPRERVWNAWTQPEALQAWFGPHHKSIPEASLDLRVGGDWRIVMASEDGSEAVIFGTYRAVEPPERLVFTWQWKDGSIGNEMLVTVELSEQGDRTTLKLTHERCATPTQAEQHGRGWRACLDGLDAFLSKTP